MKVKCSYCHSKIEFDEKEYTPGEVVSIECRRCGEETKVTIPTPEEEIQEKDGNNNTYVSPIVESTNSSKGSTVSYPINPPSVSESQKVNNRPKSPEKPLQKQQDLSLLPTSEIQPQQPTETNELYFGIPQSGMFSNASRNQPIPSLYVITDNGSDLGKYSFVDRRESAIVARRSISHFLDPGCIISGNQNPNFSRVRTITPGTVRKTPKGWVIESKAVVELINNDIEPEKVSSQPPRKTTPKKPHAHKPKTQGESVPPVNTNTQKADSNGGCANWIIIIFLVMLVGLCIWLFRSCVSDTQESMQVKVDTVYIEKSEPEYVEEVEDVVFDTETVDTIEVAAAEVVEAPADQSEISKIYLPSVSAYTSSEAYDVYPPYITEEKFGDAWATTNVVQQAIVNGDVEYFIKGEGDIEGYPLSIDAVRLKNGRLYGRYHNDYNGVKLDINGGFDSNGDLIIKLGHKSETSYWILKYVGKTDDGNLQYKGTWGRKDKPTSLKIMIKNN